jgi:hypothetical protein
MLTTFARLNEWGTHESQSEASLREAIARVQRVSVDVLHAEDAIKSNYILCQRYIEGDERLAATLLGPKNPLIYHRALAARLAPWETYRDMRSLNLSAVYWLASVQALQTQLLAGEGRSDLVMPPIDPRHYSRFAPSPLDFSREFDNWGSAATQQLLNFETCRRTTLIILACQAYRVNNGALPNSLEDLVGYPAEGKGYFATLPLDPYTGRNFVYFREGLPKPPSPADQDEFDRWKRNHQSEKLHGIIHFGKPCLWSPGSSVHTESSENPYGFVYQQWSGSLKQPDYEAWPRGQWFPIPLKYPVDAPDVEPAREKPDNDKPSDATQDAATEIDDLFRGVDTIEPPTQP